MVGGIKRMATDGKSRIIQAAKRVISRSGIAGATIRGIAEEAGLSTGAIYHYYSSKEGILYDVMDESFSETLRIAEESKKMKHSFEELVEEIYENIVKRFEKTDENRIELYLAQEAIQGNVELREKFKEKYQEWVCRAEELIQHLYKKEPTKYNKAVVSLILASIEGVVMQLLLCANPAELKDILKIYHEILKNGIPKFLDLFADI
jgi:AcrR family transcriptional regulator